MKARILWIEGKMKRKRTSGPAFISQLRKKDIEIVVVPTSTAAIVQLPNLDPDLVIVNGSSLHTTGNIICSKLHKKDNDLKILLILDADQKVVKNQCANFVLQLPFTARKLYNRIIPLIPGDEANMLHIGHIRLDLERKNVRCQGRETHLTPRLTQLLHILMQHSGEVIERDNLFRKVWNTGYTGDTRTLDVHISWLRRAIEENPKKPSFLKTIRGVGYRLDT